MNGTIRDRSAANAALLSDVGFRAVPRRSSPAGWWLRHALAILPAIALTSVAAAAEPKRVDLITDLPAAGDLAAPANGQTLFILDEGDGAVTAVDPVVPTKRWQAIEARRAAADAAPASTVRHVALACIDTSRLAVLRRDRNAWALDVHRVQAGVAADPAMPMQSVSLAAAKPDPDAATATPGVSVSPSRDWLAVCGLPAPAPPILRARIEGALLGSASARGCPVLPADGRPAAAAISLAEELVLFAPDREDRPTPSVFVTFHRAADPRRLLHLDTGLSAVRDAAFCRGAGTLWVVGGTPGSTTTPEGLWRLDAVLRQGRQAVQAACIVRLDAPLAVCCISERAIAVTHGRTRRIVSLFVPQVDEARDDDGPGQPADDPTAPAAARRNEP